MTDDFAEAQPASEPAGSDLSHNVIEAVQRGLEQGTLFIDDQGRLKPSQPASEPAEDVALTRLIKRLEDTLNGSVEYAWHRKNHLTRADMRDILSALKDKKQ